MFMRYRISNSAYFCKNVCRTFLSDEFKCHESWNSRLGCEIMQKTNLDNMYFQIKQSIQKQGKPSAIDVDIFVNKMTAADRTQVDEAVDLINQLRLSEETSNTLDSTHHATVRNFTDMELTEQLINLLDNRLEFGIFLDTYSAIYLLNHLIQKQDFSAAAKVSTLLMLQDDLENEMVRALALYACYKNLNNMPFTIVAPEEPKDTEPTEVKKVRVKFLRNEFFDGHFDEKNIDRLLGKTFLSLSKIIDKPFEASCNLIGLTLCQKYNEAIEELQKSGNLFYTEILKHCINYLDLNQTQDALVGSLKSELQTLLSRKDRLEVESMDNAVNSLVCAVVKSQESTEIQKQLQIYKSWNDLRQSKLNEELQRIEKVEQLKKIEKLATDMKLEEQKLWFFENETQIDLEIDNKKVRYPKRWFGKKKKPKVVDTEYVPPEIIKQRPS